MRLEYVALSVTKLWVMEKLGPHRYTLDPSSSSALLTDMDFQIQHTLPLTRSKVPPHHKLPCNELSCSLSPLFSICFEFPGSLAYCNADDETAVEGSHVEKQACLVEQLPVQWHQVEVSSGQQVVVLPFSPPPVLLSLLPSPQRFNLSLKPLTIKW